MNIFVSNKDPALCAVALDDRRFNKMILESAQILSTVAHKNYNVNPSVTKIYKPTHVNHPCTVWAGIPENTSWLMAYLQESLLIYSLRRKKEHACLRVFQELKGILPDTPFDLAHLAERDFVNCSLFKELPVFEAYKKTLEIKWANDKFTPTWGGSPGFPGWADLAKTYEVLISDTGSKV